MPNRVGVGAGARFRTESVQVQADQFLPAHRLGIRQRLQAGPFLLEIVYRLWRAQVRNGLQRRSAILPIAVRVPFRRGHDVKMARIAQDAQRGECRLVYLVILVRGETEKLGNGTWIVAETQLV